MTFPAASLSYISAASLIAALGAIVDLRTRKIPNRLTGPAVIAGLLMHFGLDGWRGLGSSAAAALFGGAIFVVFFIAGGMGAGDVKLMTAIGSFCGLSLVGNVLLLTVIAGGLLAIGLAVAKGRVKETFVNVAVLAVHHQISGLQPHTELHVRNEQTLRLPYGLAVAAGCFLMLATQLHTTLHH